VARSGGTDSDGRLGDLYVTLKVSLFGSLLYSCSIDVQRMEIVNLHILPGP
jgi:hypothetical protein